MGSLFGALGKLGEDYGKAAESTRVDNIKLSQLAQQMHYQNARLQLTQQLRDTQAGRLQNEQDRLQFDKDNRGWDKSFTFTGEGGQKKQFNPVTGKFRDYEAPSGFLADTSEGGKLKSAEEALGRPLTDAEKAHKLNVTPNPNLSPYDVKQDRSGQYIYVPKSPDSGLKVVHTGVMGPVPRDPNATPKAPDSPLIRAQANKWMNEGIVPTAKYKPFVELYMEENSMKPKIKLNALESKSVDLMRQLEPKIGDALKYIEDNNLTKEGGIARWSSIRRDWLLYQNGFKPRDANNAVLIKTAAALQVMGATPWVVIGRGKYLFDTIKAHLPAPTDTPELLYDKLQFLKNIVDEGKAALPEGAFDRPGEMGSGPGGGDINAALDKVFGKKPQPVKSH